MLKIILIGYGSLAESLLTGICETEHNLVGLVSWDRRTLYSQFANNLLPNNLEILRRSYKVPKIDIKSVNSYEFLAKATDLAPDIILVGSWGEILKPNIFNLPKKYCINCHPSLLPKHRGSNPYASAIIHGEDFTGVTFHLINKGIDTGDILLQEKIMITSDDNGMTVRFKCSNIARILVKKLLTDIENNNINPLPQDHSQASYFPRLKVADGSINWLDEPENIYNKIRGLYPWVASYTEYGNTIILVRKCTIIDSEYGVKEPGIILECLENGVIVSTINPEKCLLLTQLQICDMNKLISSLCLKRQLKVGSRFKIKALE